MYGIGRCRGVGSIRNGNELNKCMFECNLI